MKNTQQLLKRDTDADGFCLQALKFGKTALSFLSHPLHTKKGGCKISIRLLARVFLPSATWLNPHVPDCIPPSYQTSPKLLEDTDPLFNPTLKYQKTNPAKSTVSCKAWHTEHPALKRTFAIPHFPSLGTSLATRTGCSIFRKHKNF